MSRVMRLKDFILIGCQNYWLMVCIQLLITYQSAPVLIWCEISVVTSSLLMMSLLRFFVCQCYKYLWLWCFVCHIFSLWCFSVSISSITLFFGINQYLDTPVVLLPCVLISQSPGGQWRHCIQFQPVWTSSFFTFHWIPVVVFQCVNKLQVCVKAHVLY